MLRNIDETRETAPGGEVFTGPGQCASGHVPPLYTGPGWNMRTAQEIGIDDFQASRSPDDRYRTTPLRGLVAHGKLGDHHDGRFPTLADVAELTTRSRDWGSPPIRRRIWWSS